MLRVFQANDLATIPFSALTSSKSQALQVSVGQMAYTAHAVMMTPNYAHSLQQFFSLLVSRKSSDARARAALAVGASEHESNLLIR